MSFSIPDRLCPALKGEAALAVGLPASSLPDGVSVSREALKVAAVSPHDSGQGFAPVLAIAADDSNAGASPFSRRGVK